MTRTLIDAINDINDSIRARRPRWSTSVAIAAEVDDPPGLESAVIMRSERYPLLRIPAGEATDPVRRANVLRPTSAPYRRYLPARIRLLALDG